MNSTEYRDSYCWFYGNGQYHKDPFDELVRQKIDGTYHEPEPIKPPMFAFETGKQQGDSQEGLKQGQKKGSGNGKSKGTKLSKPKYHPVQVKSSNPFHNYGEGNVKPTNEELYMTTFNIKSQTGINPHTKMRCEKRPFILAEYARPKPDTKVEICQPSFIAKPEDAYPDEQVHGPYWVHWPSSKPFPPEYAKLEAIVRPK